MMTRSLRTWLFAGLCGVLLLVASKNAEATDVIPCEGGRYCISCSTPNVCQQCSLGWFLQEENQEQPCIPCRPNCAECSSISTCQTCRDGFVKDQYGQCKWSYHDGHCVPHCQDCASDPSACSQCEAGFFWTNRYNEMECMRGTASCGVAYCRNCEWSRICHDCQNGYYLHHFWPAPSQCRECIDNCKVCEGPVGCEICNDGYVFNSATSSCEIPAPVTTTEQERIHQNLELIDRCIDAANALNAGATDALQHITEASPKGLKQQFSSIKKKTANQVVAFERKKNELAEYVETL